MGTIYAKKGISLIMEFCETYKSKVWQLIYTDFTVTYNSYDDNCIYWLSKVSKNTIVNV